MTVPGEPGQGSAQADLQHLLAQFLLQRSAAWQTGILGDTPEEAGEVTPYQQTTLHAVDPREALKEAVTAADFLLTKDQAGSFHSPALKPLAEWPTLIRSQESMAAVPLCLGNFPQMLKDMTPLLTRTRLSALRPKAGLSVPQPDSVSKGIGLGVNAQTLMAVATFRLSRQFEQADNALAKLRKAASVEWQALLLNEEAALAWHEGNSERAAQLWNRHPEPNNTAVLFNRGLAELFADRSAQAAPLLSRAAEAIPETSGWHHLARLYVTLAE